MTDARSAADGQPRVLWLYGADAVGKSTIGWEAYSVLAERGLRVAYLDTDYLRFCSPPPDDPAEVVAANLRAVCALYRARGIDHLVVSGIVVTREDRDRFCAAIPGARIAFCRVTAGPETVRRRILARRDAEAATQGTVLTAAVRAELEEYATRSVGFAELLDRIGLEDFTLATDHRTPRELATEALTRFPGR